MNDLRDARRARGLTQAELALRAGISQPSISAYESGIAIPSASALRRIVAALGVEGPEELGYRWRTRLEVEAVGR